MFVIIQVTSGRKKFKILPKVYGTFDEAEISRKRIFHENGGQKSGWYMIVELGKEVELQLTPMSKIIKAHFYVVKGTPKGKVFPTMGWLFHSYRELENFALLVSDLIPEYDLDILETNFTECEIIDKWEIE